MLQILPDLWNTYENLRHMVSTFFSFRAALFEVFCKKAKISFF